MSAHGGRAGGALYPVLLLLGVLVFLGAMIPQVLVQASVGIRQDRSRDALVLALESAVAFAEARLKYDMGEALVLNASPTLPKPFKVTPAPGNPDFGYKKPYDWEAKFLRIKLFDVVAPEKSPIETYVYAYRIQARAWSTKDANRKDAVEVNGLMSVRILVDRGKGGLAARSLDGVTFEAMNEQRLTLAPEVSPAP